MLKKFKEKKSLNSIQVEQTSKWLNWKKTPNVGPKNAQDAPVFLTVKDKDYWIFARYGNGAMNQLVVGTLKIEEKIYRGKMTQAEGDAAIAKLRKKSEQEKSGKTLDIMDVNNVTVENLLRAYDYPPILIHGHTHRPNRHLHHVDNHACVRWVLADWYEQGSYLMMSNDDCASVKL